MRTLMWSHLFGGILVGSLGSKEAGVVLTGKDLAGTVVAALVVLSYVANGQGWWYLGSNRWAAVTMVAVAAVGCPVGARVAGERLSGPLAFLGLLGGAALVLAVLAIALAEQWALLAFAAVVVALWAGTTFRHAVSSPPAPRAWV